MERASRTRVASERVGKKEVRLEAGNKEFTVLSWSKKEASTPSSRGYEACSLTGTSRRGRPCSSRHLATAPGFIVSDRIS